MSARKSKQRGLSIIELMVGIVVSMLVGLAAAGSAAMFTASQRQGIGAGGVGIGSSTALSALKNDAALAGMGFFGDSNYLCNALALSVDAAVIVDGTAFAPINITADGNDSQIDIVYADRVESGASVLLDADSDGSSATLMSLLPVDAAQKPAVLLAKADGSGTCLVRSVTAVTDSTETDPQILTFGNAGSHNKAGFSAAPEFKERDRITLLGELNWNRYRREGNTLVLERPLTPDAAAVVLARDVIALRAQYGISNVGETTLKADWQAATGGFASLDAATLPQVRALRLGMVTRSPQRQKPDTDGNCDASLAKPQLFGATVEPDVDDWQCYRYRATTMVVPLRNLVLGLQ